MIVLQMYRQLFAPILEHFIFIVKNENMQIMGMKFQSVFVKHLVDKTLLQIDMQILWTLPTSFYEKLLLKDFLVLSTKIWQIIFSFCPLLGQLK